MMSYGRHEERPWALDEEQAEPIVRRAVESGITFFDTADVYNGGHSEVITGRLLRRLFGMREGVRRRDEGARQDDARRERRRPLAQAAYMRCSQGPRSRAAYGVDVTPGAIVVWKKGASRALYTVNW
jgi:hypothetical protein